MKLQMKPSSLLKMVARKDWFFLFFRAKFLEGGFLRVLRFFAGSNVVKEELWAVILDLGLIFWLILNDE